MYVRIPLLSLTFSPSPCPGHYPRRSKSRTSLIWLLWRLLSYRSLQSLSLRSWSPLRSGSVFSPYELLRMTPYFLTSCRPSSESRSSLTCFVSHKRTGRSLSVPGCSGTGTPPVISLEMVSYRMEYRSARIRT